MGQSEHCTWVGDCFIEGPATKVHKQQKDRKWGEREGGGGGGLGGREYEIERGGQRERA